MEEILQSSGIQRITSVGKKAQPNFFFYSTRDRMWALQYVVESQVPSGFKKDKTDNQNHQLFLGMSVKPLFAEDLSSKFVLIQSGPLVYSSLSMCF